MISRFTLLLAVSAVALAACNKGKSEAAAASGEPPAAPASSAVAADSPLKLAGSVDLPGYAGDFDHFAYDEKGDRLFLAGEDGKSIEVFKLSTGEHLKTLKDVDTPHSPMWLADKNELLVVDGGKKGVRWLDGTTYALKRTKLLSAPGADSTAYDPSSGRLFVVTGGKDVPMDICFIEAIDPKTGKIFWSTKFDANHVEALAVESQGSRIFVNVTDKNELDVLDKNTGKVLKTIKVKEAEQNAPIAMDEKTHRLFVVTRKPGKLLVLDADSLATVAEFKAPERTDQVTWDPVNRRVYVTGGEGYVSVVEQTDADHYAEVEKPTSGPGAKTAILTPKADRLYVAQSPGDTKAMAKLIWFDIKPRG